MTNSNTAMRLSAALIGVACIAVDVGLNLEFQMKADDGKLTAMAAALVLASIAATILPSFAMHSWRQGSRMTAGFGILAFAGLAALTLSTSLERSSAAREHVLDKRKTYNVAYAIANREYKHLKKQLAEAEAIVKAEYVKGVCDKKPERTCPKWHNANQSLKLNNKKLPAAYARLRKAGAPKTVDPAAQSLAQFGIPAELYARAQPLFLPIGLFFAGIAAIGVATGSATPRPQRRARPFFAPKQQPVPAPTIPANGRNSLDRDNALAWWARAHLDERVKWDGEAIHTTNKQLGKIWGRSTSTVNDWLSYWHMEKLIEKKATSRGTSIKLLAII